MAKNPKIFMDAVHGSIDLPPLCVKIIDTPEFQRLRFLKQLGSGYFVYPSACHNRFEHSLGVCHLAGKLVKALKSRQEVESTGEDVIKITEKDVIKTTEKEVIKITDKDVLCIQVAGLCHDLGHGAFSHLWEPFVEKARKNNKKAESKKWRHEYASLDMFDHLLKKNKLMQNFKDNGLDSEDVEFIKALILGNKEPHNETGRCKRLPEKAFLFDIVNNKRSGVDVDKWDYLLRDAHNLGIKVTFDYERLVQHARVIFVNGEGWQICFRDKQIDSLFDMYHARSTLHRTAYQHRVVQTIDAMIVDAFLKADGYITYTTEDGKKLNLSEVCKHMSAYSQLTDNVFHQILLGEEPGLKGAQEILKNILNRKLYKFVGKTRPSSEISREDLEKEMKFEFERQMGESSESLAFDELFVISKVKLYYGEGNKDPIKNVSFYDKNNTDKVLPPEKIASTMKYNCPDPFYRVWIRETEDGQLLHDAKNVFTAACRKLQDGTLGLESEAGTNQPAKYMKNQRGERRRTERGRQ